MKKIILSLFMTLLLIAPCILRAQDIDEQLLQELGIDMQDEQSNYRFPEIKPEASIYLGYRFVHSDDLDRIFEYEHMNDYPVAGGSFAVFKYPHRVHVDFDLESRKDYQGDINYAYGELFLSRWFKSTFFHNTDNIPLTDLSPASANYRVDTGDSNQQYGVKTGIEHFMMRLKYPDFPAHLYLTGLSVVKEGDYQQRNLLGSGYFQNIVRASQERDIEWSTLTYTIGANSHLGHAEIDLSHTEKRFEIDHGNIVYDNYTASALRAAGTFPHNRISATKGSSNVIKIHNNYNESLVASATFSLKERTNKDGGASADIFRGAGSLQWTPLTRLSFFLNYLHTDIDVDNPKTSSITDLNGDRTTYAQTVKSSISKTSDLVTLTGRYNPERGVTLKAKYSYENIERENADEWNMEETTRKNTAGLTANIRVVKNVNIKAEYIHRTTDNPSYNTEPYNSDEGSASVTWVPYHGITLLLNYSIIKDRRDDLNFSETADARDRETRTDYFLGSGTIQVLNDLTLTAGYAFMRYKIDQDIVYQSPGLAPLVDSNVPMKDTAHVFAANMYYAPSDKLDIQGLISHTISKGTFYPGSNDLLDPVSIATFSEQELKETELRMTADYKCVNGFSCGLDLRYNDRDDAIDNTYDSNEDGSGYIIMVRFKKKWG